VTGAGTGADLPLRSASAAVGVAMSVLPLLGGAGPADLVLVVLGAVAGLCAVGPDKITRGRAEQLFTACLLAGIGHLAFRSLTAAESVAEAVLVAGYLTLAAELEVCRGARAALLRWAAPPLALTALAAAAAAAAAGLADRTRGPLAVAVVGAAAAGLLLLELHRRRRGGS
jgi:hypothetical protein